MAIQPTIPQLMAFIDGENLVFRYQGLVAKGRIPHEDVVHRPDVFVWRSAFSLVGFFDAVRAYYYTSLVGADDAIKELHDLIRKQRFCQNAITPHPATLLPRIFKKPSKSQKISTVDIQLTTDLLGHVHQHHADAVVLCTGDADFIPLAEAIVRSGKRLFIHAFSEGLSEELARMGDEFVDLDRVFFKPVPPAAG